MLCKDYSEANELHKGYRLYLLPVARMNVTVQLPSVHHTGKSISNLEVMDRLRAAIRPDNFLHLKVIKSSLEFIRFECELETRALIPKVKARLDNKVLKLTGFSDVLRVRACQAKPTEPTRHDWDAFFRDADDMDEMKPGERPDTVHLQRLPTRWFADQHSPAAKASAWPLPSEQVIRTVFSVYGDVRSVHIPAIDRFPPAGRTVGAGGDGTFEAYIQYMEYVCFVRAMDAFRGAKLMRLEPDGRAYTTDVHIDFDRTKHLSEKSIRRRHLLQQKLEEEENAKESAKRAEEERRRQEADREEKARQREKKAQEKEARRRAREEKRRKKLEERRRQDEEKRRQDEERLMQAKIAMEERKILIAWRRLEAIRLLSELLRRVKVRRERAQETGYPAGRRTELKKGRRKERHKSRLPSREEKKQRRRLRKREIRLQERIRQNKEGTKDADQKKRVSHKRRKEKSARSGASPIPSKCSRG